MTDATQEVLDLEARRCAAVAAADDQHVARVVVRQHRRLHQQLVIKRFVVLGALDRAVEHQRAAVRAHLQRTHGTLLEQ